MTQKCDASIIFRIIHRDLNMKVPLDRPKSQATN